MAIKWVEVRACGTRQVVATMCMDSWKQLPLSQRPWVGAGCEIRIYGGMRVYAQGLLSEKK